jgi:hypothetical protein
MKINAEEIVVEKLRVLRDSKEGLVQKVNSFIERNRLSDEDALEFFGIVEAYYVASIANGPIARVASHRRFLERLREERERYETRTLSEPDTGEYT